MPADRPGWATWPEEPLEIYEDDFGNLLASSADGRRYEDFQRSERRAAFKRSVVTVNACAGLRNPAALQELVEAAREVYTYAAALHDQTASEPAGTMIAAAVPPDLFEKLDAALKRYRAALARLDEEPEP